MNVSRKDVKECLKTHDAYCGTIVGRTITVRHTLST